LKYSGLGPTSRWTYSGWNWTR